MNYDRLTMPWNRQMVMAQSGGRIFQQVAVTLPHLRTA
jgi:hypothetical protein